ncbi:sensor histidine kinase [Brevibacterium aurantiacum]|uniref:sensor histidine kinase n=1 Tax=Brevibacterium aurantiacum TaxID=273384 RepID=UPI0016434F62|nr:histidine kinase [Brevibacterium aurantiacum]
MKARVSRLWRRLLVLLIGGVIAVPYAAVVIWIVTALNQVGNRADSLTIIVVGIVAFALLCIPAFLSVIRALERTLAEQLLELSIPTPPRRPRTADRLRGALFYFGHTFAGALLLLTIIVLIPAAMVLAADPRQAHELSNGLIGTETSLAATVLPAGLIQALALGILLMCIAIIVVEGYFLPNYALILLGSSAADRAELAGRERARRFRRTVLAREVHDSIGHALTVTTMQAAVAKRALQTDPTIAEAAVDEIARTGREAVAELDYVLTLLRTEADPEADDDAVNSAETAQPPRRTIEDFEILAEEARSVGHPTQLRISGDMGSLPSAVAHELHRIVREALTNSLRHASVPGASVSISVDAGFVTLTVSNACVVNTSGARSNAGTGRGLQGIKERVELFGGEVRWTADAGSWTLEAVLPTDSCTATDTGTATTSGTVRVANKERQT